VRASTYTVDRLPNRTVAPHGVTGDELKRFNGACHLMERVVRSQGQLWWLTTPKGSTREEIADYQKQITRQQKVHRLPQYSAWTFETRPRLHAHILFVGNRDIVDALRRLRLCVGIEIGPITSIEGLSKKYLAKERTPQAGYGRRDLGGRIAGSHRLPGGGDRVRLSRQLERDAIEAGLVVPWRHTNAKRSAQRKDYRPRRLTAHKAPSPAGQIPLFSEMEKPVARLHHFGGGIIPPAVGVEIEFRRQRLGLTQRQLGVLIGRSQGQLANAVRGHDPISASTVNRLREILLRTPAGFVVQDCIAPIA
jgi:hypothetical protein